MTQAVRLLRDPVSALLYPSYIFTAKIDGHGTRETTTPSHMTTLADTKHLLTTACDLIGKDGGGWWWWRWWRRRRTGGGEEG